MNRTRARGFTLIELIIFIVIVGVALAGILSVMNTVVKSSADPMVRKQAMALADSILEEVLLKNYSSSGTGTSRTTYDGVDDYNNLPQTAFTTDLAAAGLSSYTIAISVAAPTPLSGINMKKVTVTVNGGTESITMTGYRANY
jgi:MSHA pilin protein MshD